MVRKAQIYTLNTYINYTYSTKKKEKHNKTFDVNTKTCSIVNGISTFNF